MGRVDVLIAEFGGFLETLVLKGDGTDFTKKAKLAETDGAVGEGLIFDTTNNRQGDGQIDAWLVDG